MEKKLSNRRGFAIAALAAPLMLSQIASAQS